MMILSHSPIWSYFYPSVRSNPVMGSTSGDGASYVKNSRCMPVSFWNARRELGVSSQRNAFIYASSAGERMGIVVEEEESSQLEVPSLKVFPGQAKPLGVSEVENGTNFAIFSQNATAVTLCLVPQKREEQNIDDEGMITLSLDPLANKTGDIWHICVEISEAE